jgi:hypothetical protein
MELAEDAAEELLAEPDIVTDQPQQLDEPVTGQEAPEEFVNGEEMVDEEVLADDAPAEQLAEGDQHEESDEEQEEGQPGEQRLKVFISYNRNANDSAVAARIHEELSKDYDVFLDTETILPAALCYEVTEDWLDTTDFIIALISSESVKAPFVMAELKRAYERFKKERRPNIISVSVAYAGPSPLRLDAYTSHFQALPWDNQNYVWLFERLRAGPSNKPLPIQKPLIVGPDIIHISDALRKLHAETFVEPREFTNAPIEFEENRLLWITGDEAVRNYVALSVAALNDSASLYEITSQRKWSEINNTHISDSTIFLRDALPANYLHESGAIGEWQSLRAIIERNNIIIASSPADEFERLEQELLRYQFTDYQRRSVGPNSYSDQSKLEIFTKRIDHMLVNGELDEDKHAWALDLAKNPNEVVAIPGGHSRERAVEKRQREMRKQFRENISRWSPADIESFVLSFSRVRSQSDLARLLKRTAAIEDEIRSWFVELDDSTRCFIATVALFSDFGSAELWEQYKAIVDHLRRFDQGLRLLPFGICRKRAYPYVSSDGPVKLEERGADAIREEVARSYREYFVELIPKLKDWSVPAGRNPKTIEQRNQRRPKIKATHEARLAIARMVGIAARLGLDDLTDILNYWATDSNIQIRKSVAFAFEHTAKSPTGVNYALNLLEKWCVDITSNGEDRWRALTAADALGYVTATANDSYVTLRALHCLRGFARSRRKDARFYASMSLRRVARYAPLSSTEGILGRLAKDDRTEVRLNVAAALNEARTYNPEAADALFERWARSDDPNRRWVALCGIVTSRKSENGDRPNKYERLQDFLEENDTAVSLASVLGETVTDDHYGQIAKETLSYLAYETNHEAWGNLARGLGAVPVGKLERVLLPILRSLKAPLFDERAVDVRRETLRRKLDDPPRFLATLKSWLAQPSDQLEVFRALTQLLDEFADSSRSQFIAAMADYFSLNPTGVSELLATLETLAPAHFASLSRSVLREALRRSLHDPARFLVLTEKQLSTGATFDSTRDALNQLASDTSPDSREELLRALLDGYAQAPALARALLQALRITGDSNLVGIIHEFNYRLIENAITTPTIFPSLALEMIRENTEALSLLNYLAAAEPQGQRPRVVRALVEARLLEVAAADELLELPALKEWTNLASLAAEVSRSFYVRKIFSRKFVRRLFVRRS